MNTYYFLFMEDYKIQLYSIITASYCTTMEDVEKELLVLQEDTDDVIILNRNEDGKLHSRYLEDRYEPAIIKYGSNCVRKYYLFDGDIKDCIHPFYIFSVRNKVVDVIYYSSKRIEDNLPINMHGPYEYYNLYERPFDEEDEIESEDEIEFEDELDPALHGLKPLLEGYTCITKESLIIQFSELHDEMTPNFKFAD